MSNTTNELKLGDVFTVTREINVQTVAVDWIPAGMAVAWGAYTRISKSTMLRVVALHDTSIFGKSNRQTVAMLGNEVGIVLVEIPLSEPITIIARLDPSTLSDPNLFQVFRTQNSSDSTWKIPVRHKYDGLGGLMAYVQYDPSGLAPGYFTFTQSLQLFLRENTKVATPLAHDNTANSCDHDVATYQGFNLPMDQWYKFCRKCGVKVS